MSATHDLAARLLRSSPVLGAEIDIRFRVLAVTVEPTSDEHPTAQAGDRRLQVVVHPVGTIAAVLADHADPDTPTVLRFDETQLSDIVALFADEVSRVSPFPAAMPDVDELAQRLSMFGSAQTGDGTRHVLHLQLTQAHDDLQLDLWATFDDVEVRDAAGITVVADG